MRKTNKFFSLLAIIALSMVSQSVWADAAPAAAATPAAPTVVVGGMLDTYYTYNFANGSNTMSGAGNLGTFFNTADNSFSLGLAELDVTATQGGASGHLSLDYGQEGALGIGGAPGIDVLQAYLSYADSGWTFNAGRFVTWMGNEVIQSKSNWNYSRSLLFWYTIPLWHNGLSVNYTSSDSKFGATAYFTNGWNNSAAPYIAPWSSMGKTYGLQISLKPDSTLGVILNGIAGPQDGVVAGGYNGAAHYVAEAIVSYTASDKLSFALDAEYGALDSNSGPVTLSATKTITSAPFWGVDLYARYQIQSDWAVALRLEEVKDAYNTLGMFGATAMAAPDVYDVEGRSGTLTIEHNFTTNLLVRLESRMDMAYSGGTQYSATTTPAGPFAAGAGSQFTETLGAVMSF